MDAIRTFLTGRLTHHVTSRLPLCAATGLLTQGKGLAEMQGEKLVGRRTAALPKSGG